MSSVPAIQVSGLQVRLGRTQVLRGVDLRVERGDLYGLLGRNGAGKTTTMRCLLGLLPFRQGSCQVFGVACQQLHQLPEALGVALDPPGLDDSLSVLQNLELARIRGGIQDGRSVEQVLELVGLAHRGHHRGDRLSHGQSRRAAVARALLGAPQLLIMDEPLSGLDPQGVEGLLKLFRRLALDEGVTVVLSSHHLREVEDVCTRVGMIEDGTTLLEGEVSELLAAAGDGLRVHCRQPESALAVLRRSPEVQHADQTGKNEIQARVSGAVDLEAMVRQLMEADCGLLEFARDRASLVDVFHRALQGDAGPASEEAA